MSSKQEPANEPADGAASGGNGAHGQEESRDEEGTQDTDVKASVAGVVEALTELVSVQTPASVWLPNKRLTMQYSGKVPGASPFIAQCTSFSPASIYLPQDDMF
jgi:hypothetical protein